MELSFQIPFYSQAKGCLQPLGFCCSYHFSSPRPDPEAHCSPLALCSSLHPSLSPSPPLKVRHSRGDSADNHKTTLQGRRRIGTTRLEKGRSSKVSRFYLSVSYVPDWAWKSPQPITTRYRQRIQEKEKEACSLWQRSWDGRRPARSWQGNPYPVAQSAHSSTTWAGQPIPTS